MPIAKQQVDRLINGILMSALPYATLPSEWFGRLHYVERLLLGWRRAKLFYWVIQKALCSCCS